jgi:hypothetical protein
MKIASLPERWSKFLLTQPETAAARRSETAVRFAFKFDSARDTGRAFIINSTRFQSLKYCPCTEHTLENFGSPTLRFGERLDFSLSFCPRHATAWPAAFQITIKNNAESSLFEVLRDVFSKNFQTSMPFG